MPELQSFLRPDVIAKLGRIDLRARLVVEGFLAGLHRSPYRGFSVEFTEYRPYMPGDEPRRIDWKLYAKTDRFYVREYEEETNLRAWLVLDASGSMGYASGPVSKYAYAATLGASLAYLLLRQKDSVGLAVFSSRVEQYVPPRQSRRHLHHLLAVLEQARPGLDTDLAGTFHELAEHIRRRGLVILLSDLFDDPERVLRALRHFRHRKHEVLVFHILDPNELTFGFRTPVVLRDLESGRELAVDPRPLRRSYQQSLQEFIAAFRTRCREANVDYHLVTTDQPFDRALVAYLAKRARLY